METQADLIVDYFQYQWGLAYPIVAATVLVFYFIFLCFKNPGLVDFAWECSFLAVGLTFYIKYFPQYVYYVRPVTFFILLVCWFVRLGGFIMITRIIPGEKDPRYEKLSANKNVYIYFFVNYQLQGLLATICATPLFFVFQPSQSVDATLNWSYYVAVVMISVGIIFEGIADQQLLSYKNRMRREKELGSNLTDGQQSKKIFQEGLWQKSRHPNLFFELMVWFGFAIAGIDQAGSAFGFLGPIVLFLIMRFLTVPLTEEHMRQTRPEYEQFCKETNMFFVL